MVPELTEKEKQEEIDSLRRVAEYWETHDVEPMTKRTIVYPCGCKYVFYDGETSEDDSKLCDGHEGYVNEKEER